MARHVSIKISPDAALRVDAERNVPHVALLDEKPTVIVGAESVPPMVTSGVSPDAASCFGPRGAVLVRPEGPLWVCDTGHHRLLGWKKVPRGDQQPADWVIGQPHWNREGRNAKGPIGAATVNVPTGICALGDGIAVADAWNHRILIWHRCPQGDNVSADVVLGQKDFESGDANRGSLRASADSFHWPYGVACHGDQLFVADSENRRVLIWNGVPTTNGQPADGVLGQFDLECRDENAGSEPSAMSMRWPHGITVWRGRLCVSDAGNNRIMVWSGIPTEFGQPCEFVLGQSSPELVDHNQSLYWPRANTLNMPYGIAAVGDWLVAVDTASSRLIGWHIDDLATNAAARALAGQPNFHEKGDNRWAPPQADSFCWPYGITACDETVVVADSGNNRVSLWEMAV